MATIIDMPKLSDTMTTGKVLSWLKQEGDTVKNGDTIAEVETDKATMELECFEEGTLLKIVAEPNHPIPVGGTIAIVGQPGENIEGLIDSPAGTSTQSTGRQSPSLEGRDTANQTNPTVETPAAAKIAISPVARRMAKEHNVDLTHLTGSGPGGRIIRKDVETYLAKNRSLTEKVSPPPLTTVNPTANAPYEDVPLSSIRETMARRLPESLGPVPHFYLETDIDVEPSLALKNEFQSITSDDIKITLTDILIKACAISLLRHPEVNSQFGGDFIRRFQSANIGLAVAGEGTLLVPVIRTCEDKSISQLANERTALVTKARQGRLSVEELKDATFSISNLGMMGITRFSAVINPPQAAILAVGAIREEPVVRDQEIIIGKRMSLTLSGDHRTFDGAEGSRFLATLKNLLEKPLSLFL